MKKLITVLFITLFSQLAMSQAVVKTVWSGDFEHGGAYHPCSDTLNYKTKLCPTCPTSHGKDWGITKKFFFNGQYSDSAQVNAADTLWFMTCPFSTLADTFVTVEFNHIAKISLFDGGIVQVSKNKGKNWNTIGANEYINTKGPAKPAWNAAYGVFNELTYSHIPPTWYPGSDSVPKNTWWQYEYFNVSAFLGGVNSSDTCMLRFALWDGGLPEPGHGNRFGWLIDSVKVKSSPCENIKPRGFFTNPQIYNASLLYSLGPFNIFAKLWDQNSGFSDAWLVYSVNGGTPDSVKMDSIKAPTVPNTNMDSIYKGVIPKKYNGVDSFKGGDTICYWINVYDKSLPCRNKFHLPNDPLQPSLYCNEFYLTNGTKLPYCDDFENLAQSNFWDTTMVRGFVGWELGNPTAGGGYASHSPTRSWTTILAGNYANQNLYYLNSPIFDFSGAITPRISFWHRRSMPVSATDNDRYRLEYSINGNPWLQVGTGPNDPAGTLLNAPFCPSTWYNKNNGYNGEVNNGIWREAFYQLPAAFTAQNQVQFRFVFTADNNSQNAYGVSIDDFCLYNPPNCDVSGLTILRPVLDYIKKAGETDSVTIVFRNIGIDTLKILPMGYKVRLANGIDDTVLAETINYPHGIYPKGLPPSLIDTFTFSKKFIVPEGLYRIFAYPAIVCDYDSSNDTTNTLGHFGFISDTISHFTNFDGPTPRWATTVPTPGTCGNPAPPTPTRWQLGAPNFGITNSAYSPTSAWDINLSTGYGINATEYIYSNMFDMTNADSAYLSFWHNRGTVSGEDGYYIEYSFNRFQTFTRLTAASQPVGRKINWSNLYPPIGTFGAGWSGQTLNWEYSQCPVNNAIFTGQPEVMFRFVFKSNATVNADGVSIDDFRIVNPDLYDAEMFDFILPQRSCVMDIAEPVEIVVKNTGKDTIFNTPVAFRYRFDPTCTGTYGPWSSIHRDTIVVGMLPALTYNHTFKDSINMSIFGCYDFCAWVDHPLDNNADNDTICEHVVENVRGCDIDFKITTGTVAPNGNIIIQDSITQDTLWLQPLSVIGPNAVQWAADICLYDVGAYKFSITASNPAMIEWWRLRDPFGDTTVLLDTVPTVKHFFWKCPPLLSASAERIRPFGPSKLPIPQTYNVNVTTRNRGSVKLSYLDLCFQIRRVKPTSQAGLILTLCDSVYFTYPGDPILFPRVNLIDTTWKATPGLYQLKAWTSLPNGNADSANYDDTVWLDFTVLDTVSNLPYCNPFDSDVIIPPWASMSKNSYDTLSSWKLGTPNQTHINGPKSPTRSWMTRLKSNYPLLDSSGVYSPEFTVDTGDCYRMTFDHNFKTEHAFDGGTVEYTLDSGKTWQVYGGQYNPHDTCYDLSTKNWFNTPYVTGLKGAPNPGGWTSTSVGGWRASFRDIKFPDVGQNPIKVVFRFRFGSDASIQNEGWAIDNFCLNATGNCIYYCCYDGIKNGDETDIDCGGSCKPCESCSDGIVSQNETGIDCGGVCPPCPSCFDGIQNGNELAPDCGAPDCPDCNNCEDGIRTENWIKDQFGNWVAHWEDGVDCGKPACPEECWVGINDLDPNVLFLGQSMPNPATTTTKIRYQIPTAGESNIVIRSTLGTEMYRSRAENPSGIHQVTVDVASWSAGVYYITLEFGDERMIEKLVVIKE